jgi:hypothetical protein
VILLFAGSPMSSDLAGALEHHECWPLQTGPDQYIWLDPPGCYANHSCNPNTGVVDHGNGEVRLIAVRDIEPSEELRYDYSTTMDEHSFTMQCFCGAPNCRGVVRDFSTLPPLVKKHYISQGIVMNFIIKTLCPEHLHSATACRRG